MLYCTTIAYSYIHCLLVLTPISVSQHCSPNTLVLTIHDFHSKARVIDNSVEQVANTGLERKSVHAIGAETAGERVVVRVRRLRDRLKYTEYRSGTQVG